MKTGRIIIVQALVALGAAGTIAASVAVPAVAAAAPAAHVKIVTAAGTDAVPNTWYHQ